MPLRNRMRQGPTSLQLLRPIRWTTCAPLSLRRDMARSSLPLLMTFSVQISKSGRPLRSSEFRSMLSDQPDSKV